jgi:hypothetical protein
MIRKVVDLPVPDPPMIPTASPRRIFMLQPRRMSLEPKDFQTSRSSISTSESSSRAAACAAAPGSARLCDSSAPCPTVTAGSAARRAAT